MAQSGGKQIYLERTINLIHGSIGDTYGKSRIKENILLCAELKIPLETYNH